MQAIDLNYSGIIIGAISFFIIGFFHPIVIKAEYYLGRKSWWIFLVLGICVSLASLLTENTMISIGLGVFAFSCFWSIKEVFEQEQRVLNGRFPKNPKRKYPDSSGEMQARK
ncbi:MAG: DUF4491 family protein [Bacteroidales bacterium]|nr:DUF4491 family protein [Bacteroidales bacterium]